MPNRVVHFEIEAKDVQRAKQFYAQAFGWNMQEQGADFGGYIVAVTGDTKEPGGINGGIYKSQQEQKEVNAYRCVIAVDDINKAIESVKASGGQVFGEPVNMPQIGTFISCEDTEGNKFSMLQPSPMMPEPK